MELPPLKAPYAGIPPEFAAFDDAKIVLMGLSLKVDEKGNIQPCNGPQRMLEAAREVELYDIETDSEVYREGIYIGQLAESQQSIAAFDDAVFKKVTALLAANKFSTLVGGSHLMSVGAIRAFAAKHENLTVLQLDAHANLGSGGINYPSPRTEGVMAEANQKVNLIQVGLRSMHFSEKALMKRQHVFFAHDIRNNLDWMKEAVELMTREVYLSIDLDVLDPSVFPATDHPVPGGLHWNETMQFLKKVCKKRNIVGFEILGLSPKENDRTSAALMARFYYKLLSYIFKKKNKQKP
jgi:agmatinase